MPRTPAELGAALLETVARVHRRGWCPAGSGNYSVVAARDPLRLILTRSGVHKGFLVEEDLLTVDATLSSAAAGTGVPSAEGALHVVLAEHGAGAVLHTHSIWGTLAGEANGPIVFSGYELLKAFPGVSTHLVRLELPVYPNTQDIAALAVELRRDLAEGIDLPGFLIAGHGLYAWGEDLSRAEAHLEALEFLLEVVGRRTRDVH